MLVFVRHVAPLECTQSVGGVLNFVVGTVHFHSSPPPKIVVKPYLGKYLFLL
jgi:hypothetical protein